MTERTTEYLLGGDPGAPALIDATGRVTTYAELRAAIEAVASRLREVAPGSRVGILASNSPLWVAGYLAILSRGLVAVPISTTFVPQDVPGLLDWFGCQHLIVDRAALRRHGPAIPGTVQVLTEEAMSASADPGARHDDRPADHPDADADADAVLMLTSGTTGRPRAVRITHRNIQANTASILAYLNLRPDDRMMVILPFTYSFGASLLHTHLRAGATLVLQNSFAFPEVAVTRMAELACTGLAGVPSSFNLLLRNSTFRHRPLPALRQIQQAGGRLPAVLVDELLEAQPQAEVFLMYGQTEATARLAYLPPGLVRAKRGSVGRAIPGVELRVLDPDGEPVAPGEVGEICATGDNVSPGYFEDPVATEAKFRGGVLRTGDLATVDADGYLYIKDRKEDFIKSWGYRIPSQDVESAALELRSVSGAAAVGVPDADAGERVVLVVTVTRDSELVPDSIIAHCRSLLPKHMVPHTVHIVDALPLNSSGKVAKATIRARLADHVP